MKTIVVEHGDHVTIQTTPRRASAILMVLAGATLQQVGDELGVTRQRIGQYVRDAGLYTRSRPAFARPSGNQTNRLRQFCSANERLARRYRVRQARTRRLVDLIWEFASANDRPPTHHELAGGVFSKATPYTGATTRLAAYLGTNSKRQGRGEKRGRDGARYGKAARRVHALYRLAGFPEERHGNWTGKRT